MPKIGGISLKQPWGLLASFFFTLLRYIHFNKCLITFRICLLLLPEDPILITPTSVSVSGCLIWIWDVAICCNMTIINDYTVPEFTGGHVRPV